MKESSVESDFKIKIMLQKVYSFRDHFLPITPNHPAVEFTMTCVIQTLNSLVLGHTKPQGIETHAHVELQIYPEQNPQHFNFIPKVYFAITVRGHG